MKTEKNNVKKLQCKQNDMQTQKHEKKQCKQSTM